MKIRAHARQSALLNVALDIFRRDSREKRDIFNFLVLPRSFIA